MLVNPQAESNLEKYVSVLRSSPGGKMTLKRFFSNALSPPLFLGEYLCLRALKRHPEMFKLTSDECILQTNFLIAPSLMKFVKKTKGDVVFDFLQFLDAKQRPFPMTKHELKDIYEEFRASAPMSMSPSETMFHLAGVGVLQYDTPSANLRWDHDATLAILTFLRNTCEERAIFHFLEKSIEGESKISSLLFSELYETAPCAKNYVQRIGSSRAFLDKFPSRFLLQQDGRVARVTDACNDVHSFYASYVLRFLQYLHQTYGTLPWPKHRDSLERDYEDFRLRRINTVLPPYAMMQYMLSMLYQVVRIRDSLEWVDTAVNQFLRSHHSDTPIAVIPACTNQPKVKPPSDIEICDVVDQLFGSKATMDCGVLASKLYNKMPLAKSIVLAAGGPQKFLKRFADRYRVTTSSSGGIVHNLANDLSDAKICVAIETLFGDEFQLKPCTIASKLYQEEPGAKSFIHSMGGMQSYLTRFPDRFQVVEECTDILVRRIMQNPSENVVCSALCALFEDNATMQCSVLASQLYKLFPQAKTVISASGGARRFFEKFPDRFRVEVSGSTQTVHRVNRVNASLLKEETSSATALPVASEKTCDDRSLNDSSAHSVSTESTCSDQDIPWIFIDEVSSLRNAADQLSKLVNHGGVCTLDCEGVPDNLYLVQIGTPDMVYVFDCFALHNASVRHVLKPILESTSVTKLVHDVHCDAVGLQHHANILLRGVLDTQLAYEFLQGDLHIGFNDLLKRLECPRLHPSKIEMKAVMGRSESYWSKRPLPREGISYAALDAALLLQAVKPLRNQLGENWEGILKASAMRVESAVRYGSARSVGFDAASGYNLRSHELLSVFHPDHAVACVPPELRCEGAQELLDIIPNCLKGDFIIDACSLRDVMDIALDYARPPRAFLGDRHERLRTDSDIVVTMEHLEGIVDELGGFCAGNRAGLDKCLHRFSANRNRLGKIIGLTIRVGRTVRGNGYFLTDIIHGMENKSVLLLGEPGSGKTTIIRELARMLAERKNVWIVDTSDEIAGPSDVPHECVGEARRMMVPSLDTQAAKMVECVQNHTPDVIIIDEIGRKAEVDAAQTVKQRGVRMIASAHGSFRKLSKNTMLHTLLGQRQQTILSGGVPKTQRVSEPVFDVVVEVSRGKHHECTVVLDTGRAIDRILEGKEYYAQRRIRDPETGSVRIELLRA
eukprot:Rmarinus@m.19151